MGSILPALLSAILIAGCQSKDGDDSNPVGGAREKPGHGRIFRGDGSPAAGAEVRIIAVGFEPTRSLAKKAADTYELETDAQGRYSLEGVPEGMYNIVSKQDGQAAFQDSVNMKGAETVVEPDTLATPGIVSGTVILQANHNPATVTVQLLGTSVFANVDDKGRFEIGGLAEGIYNLRLATTLNEYTALYSGFRIRAGRRTDILEPFRLVFTGIPVVFGLRTSEDTVNGVVRVSWKPVRKDDLLGYVVLRDPLRSQAVSGTALNRLRITDTFYLDTLFQNPGESLETRGWEYRVMAQTKNGKIGEWFESAPIVAASPANVRTFIDYTILGGELGEASIGDTLRLIAKYRNATRVNTSLAWWVGYGSSPYRTVPIEAKSGSDTLVYVLPAVQSDIRVLCGIRDQAGSTWEEGVLIKALLDPPTAQAGADTQGFPGEQMSLTGRGRDRFGAIHKLEWDIGGTGVFHSVATGDTSIRLPALVSDAFPCILRVTDDDGQTGLDTLHIKLKPWLRSAERPVPPSDWEPNGAKHPYLATLNGMIYVLGGRGSAQGALTAYDPVQNVWSVKASTDSAGPLYMLDGKLYLPTRDALKAYDPATDRWMAKAPPPVPTMAESRFTAVAARGRLYLVAGACANASESGTTQEYDPATGSWTVHAKVPYQAGPPANPRVESFWTHFPVDLVVSPEGFKGAYLNGVVASYELESGSWSLENSEIPSWFHAVPIEVPGGNPVLWGYDGIYVLNQASGWWRIKFWPLEDNDQGFSLSFHFLNRKICALRMGEESGLLEIDNNPQYDKLGDRYRPPVFPIEGDRMVSITLGGKIYVFAYYAHAPVNGQDKSAFYEFTPL